MDGGKVRELCESPDQRKFMFTPLGLGYRGYIHIFIATIILVVRTWPVPGYLPRFNCLNHQETRNERERVPLVGLMF